VGEVAAESNVEAAPVVTKDDWRDAVFKDINSGGTFQIRDFAGKKILLESFAVWCPVCTKQQNVFKTMRAGGDDSIVHISIDTDPNEDETIVQRHTADQGFDWIYAISPAQATRSLIDEFGISVVNAPSAPVILICEDQTARLLGRGVKDAEEINEEVAAGC